MILKECYINGFGNICNKHIIFNNFNEYIKYNGYGKSSLVQFLLAMLYGLETVKTNNKEFLDRKHYYPFNSSLFGGSLTIIDEDDTYKIERIFDKKSAIKDELKVYKNNTIIDMPLPGETLFKLDKESFIRLFIIKSDSIKIESTSNINESLSNISFSTTNVERSISILEDKKKIYSTKSKNSLLVQANNKKNDLLTKINNLENIEANLENKYHRIEELDKEIQNYKNNLSEIEIINSIKGYDDNLSFIDRQLLEDKTNFSDTPSLEEIDEIIKINQEKQNLTTQINSISLSTSEQEYYNYLDNKYSNNKVTDNDINNILGIEKEIEVIKSNIYNKNIEINNNTNYLSDIEDDNININNLNNNIKNITNKPKFNPLLTIISIIMDIILLFSLVFNINKLLFYILLITTFLSVITSIYFIYNDYIKYKRNKEKYNIDINNNNKINNTINNILSKYNVNSINEFNVLYNTYLSNNSIKKANKVLVGKLEEELKNKQDIVNEFYNRYKIYDHNIFKLRKELDDYNRFIIILSNNNINKEEINNKINNLNNKIIEFYNHYNINSNLSLNQIRDILININNNINNYNRIKKAKDEYIRLNNIKDINYDLINHKEEINNNKNKLETEKNTLSLLIEQDNRELEELDNLTFELKNVESNIKYYKEQYNLYNNTIIELNKAYTNITNKYINPVKDRINNYLINLNNNIESSLDSNYDLSYIKDGIIRDINHLSSGEYTLLALAYLLALADSINNNIDFIILDDPFINLDSNNINNVRTIINNIVKDKQIIYLSCHESRSLI